MRETILGTEVGSLARGTYSKSPNARLRAPLNVLSMNTPASFGAHHDRPSQTSKCRAHPGFGTLAGRTCSSPPSAVLRGRTGELSLLRSAQGGQAEWVTQRAGGSAGTRYTRYGANARLRNCPDTTALNSSRSSSSRSRSVRRVSGSPVQKNRRPFILTRLLVLACRHSHVVLHTCHAVRRPGKRREGQV